MFSQNLNISITFLKEAAVFVQQDGRPTVFTQSTKQIFRLTQQYIILHQKMSRCIFTNASVRDENVEQKIEGFMSLLHCREQRRDWEK